ncbi:MAG TPA: SH3 domain-containing protein [Candidatus Saccharimonadales bacterium]|jgi:hypothetical protein|nr:SH3 domain-containing protein [Candidatus Saccharimonadales bacterium]
MQNFCGARRECSKPAGLSYGAALFLSTALMAALTGCGNISNVKIEYVYVAAPEAALRDRVAAVYNKTGTVHNGERVQVLERLQSKRFVKIRSPRNEEGWVQDRFLASQQTYDQLERLASQYKDVPAQAVAVTRASANLHVTPGRKTEHIFQLNENERVDLLLRQTSDRNAPAPIAVQPNSSRKNEKEKSNANSKDQQREKDREKDREAVSDLPSEDQGGKSAAAPVLEDWWLIRNAQKRMGWVLGRILYVDAPIEIGQYAEGQRIVAFFVLGQAQDKDKKVPEYLTLLAENKDGQPYDYTQIRVFTWNTRRHRYETAYREHRLAGVLPVTVGRENDTAVFTLQVKDENTATLQTRKFTFNSPMVRRVYGPGEEPRTQRRAGKR